MRTVSWSVPEMIFDGRFRIVKAPGVDAPAAQQDPVVSETVTAMLRDIEDRGMAAVLEELGVAGELDPKRSM